MPALEITWHSFVPAPARLFLAEALAREISHRLDTHCEKIDSDSLYIANARKVILAEILILGHDPVDRCDPIY